MKQNRTSILFRVLVPAFLLASILSCQNQKETDESPWLQYALEAEKYLNTALLDQEEGIAWKVMPDSVSGPDVSLYSGTPGVVLFYLQLFESTSEPDFLEKAKAGADFLLASLPDTAVSSEQAGLYTGLAGIGYTLAEAYRNTGDERYKTGLVSVIDLLDLSAEKTPAGIHWGQTTDIVYGAAGIGLFLHDIADGFDLPKADSLS